MEKLKAEIARKKAEAEALRQRTAQSLSLPSGEARFIRQRDVLEARQTQAEEALRREDAERESRSKSTQDNNNNNNNNSKSNNTQQDTHTDTHTLSSTRKRESEQEDSTHAHTETHTLTGKRRREEKDNDENTEALSLTHTLSTHEVKQLLRALGEPVTLFGESDAERAQRLALARVDFARHGDAHAERAALRQAKLRNELDEKALEEDDARDEKAHSGSDREGERGPREKDKQIMRYDPNVKFSEMSELSPEEQVYKFFRTLLKEWEHDLNARPEAAKNTAKGKQELRDQKHCKDYIRPLFKLCRRKEVPFDILHKLQLMVKHCEDGDFVKANDEYIRTAIGNAAWPIGLTMVGIHERSGRERISTSKIAHVMNNEQERKYLTSVKRLMTFAQTKRPDVPPSKKVLF